MYQAMNEAAGFTAFLLVSNLLAELQNRGQLKQEQAVELVDRTLLTVERHFHEVPEAEERHGRFPSVTRTTPVGRAGTGVVRYR